MPDREDKSAETDCLAEVWTKLARPLKEKLGRCCKTASNRKAGATARPSPSSKPAILPKSPSVLLGAPSLPVPQPYKAAGEVLEQDWSLNRVSSDPSRPPPARK